MNFTRKEIQTHVQGSVSGALVRFGCHQLKWNPSIKDTPEIRIFPLIRTPSKVPAA